MKYRASSLFWLSAFFIFCFANAAVSAAEPPKKALLVAVGNYPFETGWKKISSLNDVALLRKALAKQGFEEADIHVLTDEAATKSGVEKAIRDYLIETAKPGGVAFFHFSGHGQQVADDNGDELDGYDEALVPINSPLVFNPGVYEGENLLRDEELGALLDEVRRKLGPTGHLTVVLDACHSGTGTRGSGIARGTTEKMASPDYIAGKKATGKEKSNLVEGEKDERNLAPMVSFFGAAQHQLNFETVDEEKHGVGSLTYALCKKLTAAPKGTTYRGLFEQVKTEMSIIAATQNPQVEGPLDQELLGGQLLGAPEYYRVSKWNDPGSLTLEAGWLQGIHEGTEFGFFSPETRTIAGKTPIAKGKVTYADASFCRVNLESDLAQETALSSWAFVLSQSFGDLSVQFKNSLPEGHPVLPILRSKLEKTPVVREGDPADLELTMGNDASRGGALQLLTSGGMVVSSFDENLRPEILADRILREMMSVAQVRFLKSLEMESSVLPVTFEIIPIKYDPANNNQYLGDLNIGERMDENGNLRLKVGDGFRIKVTNNGYRPAYFTLLDIQPDNVMNVLMPSQWDARETAAEFVVEARSSFEPPAKYYKKIAPPLGTEVFKLIATEQPIDLRSVTKSRGQTRSGASQNPFEKLLADSFFNESTMTRGGAALSMSAEEVHVETFVFTIDD